MMPRSIAKVNAKSIDGFFGVGTSCFFIRGTILSDTPVDGEYPSLSFMRPGNIVEIASFDGVWAVVTIRTRPGNRPGDNVITRMYLRDDDLKAHGVDCARIASLNGLPFAFDVASLAAEGLFDHRDLEPYTPVEDDPDPPAVEASAAAWIPPASSPEPQRAAAPPPEPPPEPPPAVNETGATFDMAGLIEMLRSGRSPFGKIGASIAAVAVPVLLYLALTYLKNSKPPDDETP